MSLQLTILCENSVEQILPGGLIGEHGFACHLRTIAGDFLFDTGSGLGLLHNCAQLGIDLSSLQGVILSHGHADHCGGLLDVLQQTGPIPVYGHPDLFTIRYSRSNNRQRDISISWPQAELERKGADFRLQETPLQLTAQLLISGEIPRQQTGGQDPNLCITDKSGQQVPDPLNDDLSLYLLCEKGLVILLGCAHAGLCNIIEHAIASTGVENIHLLLGGTHLMACSNEQLTETIEQLDGYSIEKIGGAHCTGRHQARHLAEHFGERFFYASVGTRIEL